MLNIILNQCNKPTIKNFNTLCQIAYDLTDNIYFIHKLEFYYQSNALCGYNSFFTEFWQLRSEVKNIINK